MISEIDKEIKKVLNYLTYEKIFLFIGAILLFHLTEFIPQNFMIVLLEALLYITYIIILLIKVYLRNQSYLARVENVLKVLKKYHINTPDKIKTLMDINKSKQNKLEYITVTSFLITGASVLISLVDNPAEHFSVIFPFIIELLIFGMAIVLLYKICSNNSYLKEFNEILFYLYLNYDEYFDRSEGLLKRIFKRFI